MSLDHTGLVQRLRASRPDDFEKTLVFREEILDRPEIARLLLQVMYDDELGLGDIARAMLCHFGPPALKPIDEALQWDGPGWRDDLLGVIWAIVSLRPPHERRGLLVDVWEGFDRALDDPSVLAPNFDDDVTPEIEYTYRVCDEAYAVWRRLTESDFEEPAFQCLDFSERDAEIRFLRARIRPAVA